MQVCALAGAFKAGDLPSVSMRAVRAAMVSVILDASLNLTRSSLLKAGSPVAVKSCKALFFSMRFAADSASGEYSPCKAASNFLTKPSNPGRSCCASCLVTNFLRVGVFE